MHLSGKEFIGHTHAQTQCTAPQHPHEVETRSRCSMCDVDTRQVYRVDVFPTHGHFSPSPWMIWESYAFLHSVEGCASPVIADWYSFLVRWWRSTASPFGWNRGGSLASFSISPSRRHLNCMAAWQLHLADVIMGPSPAMPLGELVPMSLWKLEKLIVQYS